jgi:hypothetical protein
VIRQGVDALRAQVLGRLLDRLAAERVDDARRAGRLRADELQQLTTRIDLRLDAVLDVGRSKLATKCRASGAAAR